MPFKSKIPCKHPGCSKLINQSEQYCEEHKKLKRSNYEEKEKDKEKDRYYDKYLRNKEHKALYNTARWKKVRDLYLSENPLCNICKREGILSAANVVDHIIPHEGDKELFWSTYNYQSLCKRCHDIKTAKEDGGFGNGKDYLYPFLKESKIPLKIVCGSPASGKTTYVKKQMKDNDIIIDVDLIVAEMFRLSLYDSREVYTNDKSVLEKAMKERNRRLLNLSSIENEGQTAWFITLGSKQKYRNHWRDTLKPVEVIVLETQIEQCYLQAYQDDTRKKVFHLYDSDKPNIIKKWWNEYEQDDRDTVIKANKIYY